MTPEIQQRCADLRTQLMTVELERILQQAPLANHLAAFDRMPATCSYRRIPLETRQSIQELFQREGVEMTTWYVRLLVIALIARFDPKLHRHALPTLVIEQYGLQFLRILDHLDQLTVSESIFDDDCFLKDLSLCTGLLAPLGARVAELESGFSRSRIMANPLPAAWRFLLFLLRQGFHNAPYYQMHVHLHMLEAFNPPGWRQTLIRAAHLLAQNPQMRGLFVSGWLYDPQLDQVTPHLSYMRQIGLESGALLFRTGPDPSGSAFVKSHRRRQLHEAGQYDPQAHILIWPRHRLMKWARHQDVNDDRKVA